MPFWLGIVVAFILLAVVVNAAVLYFLYRLSPERKWRGRVQRHLADAENRLRSVRNEQEDLAGRRKQEFAVLRRGALESLLKSSSIAELEAYPGVGPGTVGKLRGAGFTNLAMLQGARIRVRGLGTRRLADIDNAVRDFVKQAQSRFQAGACPEAQDLSSQRESVRSRYARQEALLQARVAGVEAVIAKLRPLLNQAGQVTFFRYLRRKSQRTLPQALLNRPLPDLEKTIQLAVNQAAAVSSRTHAVPVALPPAVAVPSDGLFHDAARLASASNGPLRTDAFVSATEQPPGDLSRLETTIAFAFAVARADGRVARKEKELIHERIQEKFGDDLALLNRARGFCAHYEVAAIDLDKCLHEISRLFPLDERQALFQFASEIADAAGQRNQREVEFLEKIATRLGISPIPRIETGHEPVRVPIPATPEESLAVLELEAGAPVRADLVRRQFNLLSERYAPAKFEAMGPEFIAMAETKRAAVEAAAAALLEQWGETLQGNSSPDKPSELRHNPDLDAILGV